MSPEGGTGGAGTEPGAALGGRYRLERRIASGGMATVWLARDEELDRDVAVKVLSDVLGEDPSYVARFRREARVAAGVSHPNLVRMFDYAGEAERPYIVMEYVGGGTLADRIRAGATDEVDPERLARQLLGALEAIHAAGVVHRDAKPSNVLLDAAGDAHLTDFGIAQPADATPLTGTGQVIGTLKYMAPEVLAGKPATERSDLYALGACCTRRWRAGSHRRSRR
jgi:eukaryotic-like serine/threonine-protein kinase